MNSVKLVNVILMKYVLLLMAKKMFLLRVLHMYINVGLKSTIRKWVRSVGLSQG